MRKINIANDKKRDALIGFELTRTKDSCHYRTASGKKVSSERFLRYSGETATEKLFVRYADFEYGKYIFFHTNYSSDRKEPLKRDIKIADSIGKVREFMEKAIAENIKKNYIEIRSN